ncbi:MAG: competence protein ComEC family protein [Bacteroidia bacterium]|nr:competence protein ComEC family protein [Bacteroidia bacterium]NNK55101.1 ComEC/Rec2 family competence protein [Flavobacteriaceae bacterium]
MRFVKFAIVRFSLFLVLGIVTGHFLHSVWWFYLLPGFFILFGVLWWLAKRQLFQNVYFALVTYSWFFILGLVNYQIRLPQFQPNHYSTHLTESEQSFMLEISEILKPDRFNFKGIAEVRTISNHATHGRILFFIPLDSLIDTPVTGDQIFTITDPSEIQSPLNPHQFNYARYMQLNDVYHQMKLSKSNYRLLSGRSFTIITLVDEYRGKLLQKLDASAFGKEEKGIIEALVLGHRHTIDRDLYRAYAAAGAIHILAVSGLHVGIIYFILQLLLSPLKFVRKGKTIKVILLVLLLWAYATITGLSPSVTRAVTMFTFFGMSQLLNRPTNSINTLFLSFFFLLLWNPKWMFHVGFQLSYSAVFFILWIQPRLYRLYHPKYYLDKLIWTIITVSLAAQIGVGPLSIYYFNQFPGLFLLSNLVILPFISVIVSLGLIIVALLSIDLLPDWFAASYNFVIGLLNDFVKWVSVKDSFLFSEIHFSRYHLFGSYLVILAFVLLWQRLSRPRIIISLCSILLFVCAVLLDKFETSQSKFIVFHKNRSSLVGIQQGNSLKVLKRDSVSKFENDYPIKAFSTAININEYSEIILPNAFSFGSKRILVVDSTGVYPGDEDADIVLLCDSPKIHLERLIDSLSPGLIISDGSNYRSYVDRWRKTCELKKLPFHHTGDRGAFTLE